MTIHVIRQGECLIEVAARYGHRWETIWDHPNNKALRSGREDPHILFPGDAVFVPDLRSRTESLGTNRVHRFQSRRPRALLRLRLVDEEGRPRKGVPYAVDIDGEVRTGSTDGDGKIEQPMGPRARRIVLRVEDPARDPSKRRFQRPARDEPVEEYVLHVGSLDPISTPSGVKMRLLNMGYYQEPSAEGGEEAPRLAEAIRAFQLKTGVEPTGELSADLASDIRRQHGC